MPPLSPSGRDVARKKKKRRRGIASDRDLDHLERRILGDRLVDEVKGAAREVARRARAAGERQYGPTSSARTEDDLRRLRASIAQSEIAKRGELSPSGTSPITSRESRLAGLAQRGHDWLPFDPAVSSGQSRLHVDRLRELEAKRSDRFMDDLALAAEIVLGRTFAHKLGMVHDPSPIPVWEKSLDVAGILPLSLIARAGRGAAKAFGIGARASRVADKAVDAASVVGRVVGSDIYRTTIPATQSRIMRHIEQAASDLVGKVAKKSSARRAAFETSRRLKTLHDVYTSTGVALQRLGKRMSAAEQAAVLVVAENVPISVRKEGHRRWMLEAIESLGESASVAPESIARAKLSIALHNAHIKVLDDAAKYIDESSGSPVLKNDAPERLKRALDLVQSAAESRERVLEDLAAITNETLVNRINIPGRIFLGAYWDEGALKGKPLSMLRKGMKVGIMDGSDRVGKVNDIKFGMAKVTVRDGNKSETFWIGVDKLVAPYKGKFVGAEDFVSGRFYVAQKPGVPGVNYATVRGQIKAGYAWLSRTGRAVASGLRKDPELIHNMKGELIRYGLNRTDAVNLTAESTLSAWRLLKTKLARDELLRNGVSFSRALDIAEEHGSSIEDLFVPVRDTHRVVFRTIRNDAGDVIFSTKSPISRADWGEIDALQILSDVGDKSEIASRIADMMDDSRDVLRFMGMVSDETVDDVKRIVFPSIREALRLEQDGIPVKWVRKEAFYGIFDEATRWHIDETVKHSSAGKAIANSFNVVNDLARFGILFPPPSVLAYMIPNVLSNAALALIDQRHFLPKNIVRAFKVHRKLRLENQIAHDLVSGAGVTLSIFQMQTGLFRRALGGYIDMVHRATDLVWRRAALYHHLEKLGVNVSSPKALDDFYDAVRAGDSAALDLLDTARKRANDAMIDFERLSAVEKDVLSKVFFLYPWMKGSARWTARLPVEHPFVASAIGVAYYKAREEREKDFGPGPWYSEFEIEIPKSIVEHIPWADPRKRYTTNILNAILPAGQPVELARTVAAVLLGEENAPQLFDMLSPPIQWGMSIAMRRDPETGQEIEGNIVSVIYRVVGEDIRTARALSLLSKEQYERDRMLYPRTAGDVIAQGFFLGSLAPRPLNVELSRDLADTSKSTKIDVKMREARRYIDDFTKKWKKLNLGEMTDEFRLAYETATDNLIAIKYAEGALLEQLKNNEDFRRSLRENRRAPDSLTNLQRFALYAAIVRNRVENGDFIAGYLLEWIRQFAGMPAATNEAARKGIEYMQEILGLNWLSEMKSEMSSRLKEQAIEAEFEAISGA